MKIWSIMFILLLTTITPVCVAEEFVTTEPIYNTYNESAIYGLNKISEIEHRIYGQAFREQHILARLERLEKDIFNRTYPNSSIDQRVNNIIYTYKKNAEIVQQNPNSNTSKLKKFFNNLSGAMIGIPTGYTPPIYSDPYSTPYYSIGTNGIGQHYGQYSDYYGKNGWYRNNHGYGTGSGVHIID